MTVLPSWSVVVIYTVESRVEMAIRAVGKDGKTSEGDWTTVTVSGGPDESTTVRVNVGPGTGGDVSVETTKLVTVNGGSLTRLEGDRPGETELMSGIREGEDMLVGGKDELGLTVIELSKDEGGMEDVGEGRDVKDVREGLETVVVVGKVVDGIVEKGVGIEEEDRSEFWFVMEDDILRPDGETVRLELGD